MAQNFGSPVTDLTKDAREALRLALGLDTTVPFADYINHIPTSQYSPSEVFSAGQNGFWYEADTSTLSQDASGVTPVTSNNDPVGGVLDKSGNGNHAIQSVSSRRMLYKESPPRLFLDKVDDELVINIPTGGWLGTMVIATEVGTAAYEVNIPEGAYLLGGKYFAGSAIVGVVFRHGTLTDSEKVLVEKYFVSKGAVESFINVTNLGSFWRAFEELIKFPLIDTSSATNLYMGWVDCSSLTSFPLIDTSSATNFSYAWYGCSSLTSFPLIDTSSATNLYMGWRDCSSLTSFPLIDTSSATNLSHAWYGCSSLTDFPAHMFDAVKGGNFSYAFTSTNLSQASIDGILVSLVTSGIATGTRTFGQSGGSVPSATGQAAIDTLRSRGWTVTVTGGY